MTAAVLITVIGAALASGDGKMESRAAVLSLEEGTYRVIYGAKEDAVVKITITDAEGHVLRTDRIKSKGGFMKPYNLEKLEEGTYSIQLRDEYGEFTHEVKIGDASTAVAVN